MSNLNSLPLDIYYIIESFIDGCGDLAALARCNSRLHEHFLAALYRHAATTQCHRRALFWSAAKRRPRVFEAILAASRSRIDVNIMWLSERRMQHIDGLVHLPELVPVVRNSSSCQAPKGLWEEIHSRRTLPLCYWSLLHVAAAGGNAEIVKMLMDHGADPAIGCMGLCYCFKKCHTVGDRVLGEAGLDLSRSWTPLHVAICRGHTEAARVLMSHGCTNAMVTARKPANDSYKDVRGLPRSAFPQSRFGPQPTNEVTTLHAAAMKGYIMLVRWLVDEEKVKDVDSEDLYGQTPLCYAYVYQNWECFKYLLELGADINKVTIVRYNNSRGYSSQETMLLDAIRRLRFNDAKRLIALGADTNFVGGDFNMPLISYLCQKPWDAATLPWQRVQDSAQTRLSVGAALLDDLIARGAPIHNPEGQPIGAVNYAAGAGNLVALRRLVEAGESVDGTPQQSNTPLQMACGNKHLHIASFLLEHGASPTYVGHSKQEPIWALYANCLPGTDSHELFELLLSHGARPFRGTSTGEAPFTTPLEYLISQGDWKEFNNLLQRCGGPALRDDDMIGFWNAAKSPKNPRLIKMVLELDQKGVIIRRDRTVIDTLFLSDPIPTDLILRLLDQAPASPISAHASSLRRAIQKDADLEFIQQLVKRRADDMYVNGGMSAIGDVLAARSTIVQKKRYDIVEMLMNAGASVYDGSERPSELRRSVSHHTHLSLAINQKQGNEDIVRLMLEKEPLWQRSIEEVLHHLEVASRQGHFIALQTVASSSQGLRHIAYNSLTLIHLLLDNIFSTNLFVKDMNKAIDCLKLFLDNDDSSTLDTPQPRLDDSRTAREKLLALMVHYMGSSAYKMNAVTWCLQRRVDFGENDDRPRFKMPETRSPYADDMDLLTLGQKLYRDID